MEGFVMEVKAIWNGIQVGIAAFGGWLGYLLGGYNGFLYGLITFVVADYITGLMCAVVEKKLSSEIGARGIAKKVLIFVIVAMAHILDKFIIGTGEILRDSVLCFYLANEGISLLENTAKLGLPIPDRLKIILAQIKSTSENNSSDKTTKTGGTDNDNQ